MNLNKSTLKFTLVKKSNSMQHLKEYDDEKNNGSKLHKINFILFRVFINVSLSTSNRFGMQKNTVISLIIRRYYYYSCYSLQPDSI